MTLDTKAVLARITRDAFRRRGVYRVIVEEGLPCETEGDAEVIGENSALQLAVVGYLCSRAVLLGYSTSGRLAARQREISALIPQDVEFPAPYSIDALGRVKQARSVALATE